MLDIIERLEAGAEARYNKMLQPDGRLKCECGKFFDEDSVGGTISPDPYSMPICVDCFEEYMAGHNKQIQTGK